LCRTSRRPGTIFGVHPLQPERIMSHCCKNLEKLKRKKLLPKNMQTISNQRSLSKLFMKTIHSPSKSKEKDKESIYFNSLE
jgi:hypothetical protein